MVGVGDDREDEASVKEPWQLGPDDRAQPAGRVLPLVLEGYLLSFREHEHGVRADEDPEELHDFRVALRRSRSLLATGSQVFPAEELQLLKALAAWMAAVTSPVRDLDVLLGDLPSVTARLSDELADGLEPLTAALGRRRRTDFDMLIGALDSDRYGVLLRRWQLMSTVFRVGGGDPGPDASRPAGEVVDTLIMRSFRRARKRGRSAMATDDRAEWHELRKALKRFRYLVAAFAPMYPAGSFGSVQKRLADLQETLGRLQDHHVQASLLEEVGAASGGRAALAAGALADALHRDAEVAHAHCREAWAAFDRPKVRRRLDDLLGGGASR
jgi:CHAD domain-containing protein